jgi:hypothetical protein
MVAWLATPLGRRQSRPATDSRQSERWTVGLCALAAALPDADVLFTTHRTWTHSLGAALLVGALMALGLRLAGRPALRLAALGTLAYVSHVLLDWLGTDSREPRGVMALWPLTSTYYKAQLDLFEEISRRYWNPDEFIWGNLRSLAWELAILAPPFLAVWWRRARSRESEARNMKPGPRN